MHSFVQASESVSRFKDSVVTDKSLSSIKPGLHVSVWLPYLWVIKIIHKLIHTGENWANQILPVSGDEASTITESL